jgi:hypothetical protein
MANSHKVWQENAVFASITGFERKSKNDKTGDMLQLTVLSSKVDPKEAKHTGGDASYCGGGDRACPLHNICYVVEAQMPLAVWRTVADKKPVEMPASKKPIRLGAYGDPAFLPLDLLEKVTDGRKHTGYTHQWEHVSPDYSEYLMASVESEEGRQKAKKLGYRTFKVMNDDEKPKTDEVMCPYYDKGVQCVDCGLCAGTRSKAKDIATYKHGFRKGNK